jgi:long-chain fatty acid transport protein
MLKKQNGSLLFLAVATISCVLCFSGSAIGSGFAIIEQSAASAGYAYAGVAAAAQDASTIFFTRPPPPPSPKQPAWSTPQPPPT